MTDHSADYVALVAAIDALHKPTKQEAERWPGDGLDPPVTAECLVQVEVCEECGYDHDGDYPVFRAWPCPTWRAAHAPHITPPETGSGVHQYDGGGGCE